MVSRIRQLYSLRLESPSYSATAALEADRKHYQPQIVWRLEWSSLEVILLGCIVYRFPSIYF